LFDEGFSIWIITLIVVSVCVSKPVEE